MGQCEYPVPRACFSRSNGGGDQIVTYKLHLLNLNSFFPFPSALLFTGL